MICQKCTFPHANPLGCLSCGWVYDKNYHPSVGAAPTETAQWIVSQPEELLVKIYGRDEAVSKLQAARQLLATQKTGDNSTPAPPPYVAPVITATVEPVVSPFAKVPAPDLEEAAQEHFTPEVDARMHPTEAPAPTVE